MCSKDRKENIAGMGGRSGAQHTKVNSRTESIRVY